MKTMQIGSAIIHLSKIIDLNCVTCDGGVLVQIEFDHAQKEYFVPDFNDPEFVTAAIHKGIRESENFNLLSKLCALERIYGG